jgi:hypothetical protein
VPDYLAAFALAQAASLLRLLSEAERALPPLPKAENSQ